MAEKYQLRHVAGVYWLVDVSQHGFDYKKPLPLNESAATIWSMLASGIEKDDVAEELCEGDKELKNVIIGDIEEFIEQLESAGFDYREVVE